MLIYYISVNTKISQKGRISYVSNFSLNYNYFRQKTRGSVFRYFVTSALYQQKYYVIMQVRWILKRVLVFWKFLQLNIKQHHSKIQKYCTVSFHLFTITHSLTKIVPASISIFSPMELNIIFDNVHYK